MALNRNNRQKARSAFFGNNSGLETSKYSAKLRPFYNDSGLIKVITGIRRCGKSSLLITVLNELFEQGIPETNLIYLNLDRREYRNVTTPDQLDQLIEQAMSNAYGAGLRYLFIDEVQRLAGGR